ncbi:MAG: endonuclease/exonuclease/phosphatase family protein [Reichenbachiella sp.]|uniref:endonuclease/exonuclease/phosphatase family protein n=1 Tax=Reichenbachiella sp. TaxID=2184521 RepID=UPI00326416F2
MLITILIVLSILAIISTLAPLIKVDHWSVKAFDFPFVQLTIFTLFTIAAWTFVPHITTPLFILLAFLTLAACFRLWVIFPYLKLAPKKVPNAFAGDRLKVLSANVLMYNENHEGFLKVITEKDPDILLVVEADQKWLDAISESMNQMFAYNLLHPLDNTYGMLLFSKLKLKNPEVRFLVEDNVPSFSVIFTLQNGQDVQFFGLHPKPPAPSENETSTPRDAELILVGRESRTGDLPVIVAGDMNDVAWSHTSRLFIRISGLLDPRMGRGFFNTYHAKYPFLRWPLDHIFISHHFKVLKIELLNNFDSDHFPIYVELTFDPSIAARSNTEKPDQADRNEAADKLNQVR